MSKTILTNAFSAYKAQCEATNQPIIMDEFVFALVPNQDPDAAINPDETLPADAHIKGRFSVTRKGMINPDAVVYSIILGTDVGTWDFNWIGLVNSQTNTVGTITHIKTQSKTQADPENNTEGDTLARNIITPYLNASNLTQITVTAEVWQLDFNNRLTAIDERIRIDNMDMFGHASFIEDGWKVTSSNAAVSLTAGVAYIAGLRCVNIDAMPINLNDIILPKTIYLEACFMGGINSAWQTTTSIVIADSHPPVRTENGITYYSNPIATIASIDNITDLRPLDWRTTHLNIKNNPHEQYLLKNNAATNEDVDRESTNKKFLELPQLWRVINPIKESISNGLKVKASLSVYGVTKLSSATNSTSESLAATPRAIKTVNDSLTTLGESSGKNTADLDFIKGYLESMPKRLIMMTISEHILFSEGFVRGSNEIWINGLSGNLIINKNTIRSGFFEVRLTPTGNLNLLPNEWSVDAEIMEVANTSDSTHKLRLSLNTWAKGIVLPSRFITFSVSVIRRVDHTDLDHMWS